MIREMNDNDLESIILLENELFTLPWHIEDYLYEIHNNEFARLFVLEIDNKIVGYGGLHIIFDQAQVTTIGISKQYQKKGYGQLLLEYLLEISKINHCETISLEVRVSNENAISLYKKKGFETINIRKSYYSDNHEDAYLMMKGI